MGYVKIFNVSAFSKPHLSPRPVFQVKQNHFSFVKYGHLKITSAQMSLKPRMTRKINDFFNEKKTLSKIKANKNPSNKYAKVKITCAVDYIKY